MVQARIRTVSTALIMVIAGSLVAWSLAAPRTAPAADAAALLPYQTLYLTERFGAGGPVVTHDASVLPETLVALKGEREGFQVALNNTSGKALKLGGDVVGDAALSAAQASGQVTFELLRVGFVNVPQGSTGLGTSGGMYADPLPPLRNDSAAGNLSISAGEWGGLAVIAKVRTDAGAGVYGGSLELFEGGSAANGTVHARVPFSLTVGNTTNLQAGQPKSFKTVMNVEGEAYWLQHSDMRNGPSKWPTYADRMAQANGLLAFLDTRGVTPLELPFGNPAPTGAYTCAYAPPKLGAQRYLDQVKNRYFGKSRDIDPSQPQFPIRMLPTHTNGCNPDSASGGFEGTIDKYRTTGVKQDDVFDPKAPAYYRNVSNAWSAGGFWRTGSTYVKNPFDEPGEASARQKTTMSVEVPKATIALHKAFGAKAKVVLAAWPRDSRRKQLCRVVPGGSKRCTTMSGDGFDNRKMWDGVGSDDVDVWMPHFSRLFGRTTPPILAPYKVNRERDYANRLKSIRAKKNRETWAYNFYTATKLMPQVTIDAPGTDPRLQYLMLARDGHTGLFISNLMMGWGTTVQAHPGGLRRKGDPYEQALYFKHPLYGFAAGWGTFLYPGYNPALGLAGETQRNSEGATPVSSLRLEALRDGTEDANLIQTYRTRFGDAAVQAKLKSIFPGHSVKYPATLGNVVGPGYDNGNNMAMRMEAVRRQMITELG